MQVLQVQKQRRTFSVNMGQKSFWNGSRSKFTLETTLGPCLLIWMALVEWNGGARNSETVPVQRTRWHLHPPYVIPTASPSIVEHKRIKNRDKEIIQFFMSLYSSCLFVCCPSKRSSLQSFIKNLELILSLVSLYRVLFRVFNNFYLRTTVSQIGRKSDKQFCII